MEKIAKFVTLNTGCLKCVHMKLKKCLYCEKGIVFVNVIQGDILLVRM